MNNGVLAFNAGGRIRNANAIPPTDFNAGTPTINGNGSTLLCAANVAPEVHVGGVPFTKSGILCATAIGAVSNFAPGGVPLTSNGEVAVDAAAAIAFYNAGLPYTAAGKLAFAAPEVPGVVSGFSNGFSNGFG